MSTKARHVSILAAVTVIGAVMPGLANNLGENRSWSFSTSADRANKAAVRNVIELKQGGRYGMAGVQNTINYNIGRDYVNCSVSASTVGNSGTNATSSSFGSPSNAVAPATSATATGNATADSQSLSGELPGAGGGSPLLDLNTLQDNSGAQTSDVTGVTVDNQIGTQSGSATGNQVALNSQQTNDSSQLQSSVQGSSACAFDRNTGSGQ